MHPFAATLAIVLVACLSFLLGLLQRRTARSVVLRAPTRIGGVPRTELQGQSDMFTS